MIAKTHIAFALSISAIPVLLLTEGFDIDFNPQNLILFFVGISIGSLLPDIDEPNSVIGQKTLFVSHFIKKFFGHRGITHSFLFPLFVGILLYPIFLYAHFSLPALFGLVLGCYLHIMGDMLTKSGCPFYLPINSKNRGLLPYPFRFYTGGQIDKGIGWVCMIFFLFCASHFAGFDLSWLKKIDIAYFFQLLQQ